MIERRVGRVLAHARQVPLELVDARSHVWPHVLASDHSNPQDRAHHVRILGRPWQFQSAKQSLQQRLQQGRELRRTKAQRAAGARGSAQGRRFACREHALDADRRVGVDHRLTVREELPEEGEDSGIHRDGQLVAEDGHKLKRVREKDLVGAARSCL